MIFIRNKPKNDLTVMFTHSTDHHFTLNYVHKNGLGYQEYVAIAPNSHFTYPINTSKIV